MVVSKLRKFIDLFDNISMTPNEEMIEKYVIHHNIEKYKKTFVRFCFYHWDTRHRIVDLEEALFETIIKFERSE
tara:strand:- start:367 stop:588 length:222 start_codon:yes stop_codon:yes gene_type:complete